MNIAFASDNHYAPYLKVTIFSILKHNAHHKIHFYILDLGIDECYKQELKKLILLYQKEITFLTIDIEQFKNYPNCPTAPHISKAANARLKIADYLPNLDKIIYLDIDTIIMGDIIELWQILNNPHIPLAACCDVWVQFHDSTHIKQLGLDENNTYFNSGVLAINLKQWRQRNISKQIDQWIQNNHNQSKLKFVDQDLLNLLFHQQVYILDSRFNTNGAVQDLEKLHQKGIILPQHPQYQFLPTSPIIIYHFTSESKAWSKGKEDKYYLNLLNELKHIMDHSQPQHNKQLILTALNNNQNLWFEHFIPFVLSLKDTHYQGDIGVIDYGLSEEQKHTLHQNHILIFSPQNQCTELLLDRHLSAAQIATTYDYHYIAVYDADIWFPQKELTVFQQIQDNKKLYCTYDPWRCSFLTQCIQPEYIDEVNQSIDILIQKNKYVWQAALIVAHKNAWLQYQNYIQQQLTQEKFIWKYGIDSTILNLYSLQTNQIAFLSQKYNCVPVWGIQQTGQKDGFFVFNEAIEGLHITRNHRTDPLITYPNIHPNKYYQQGKSFQLKTYTMWHITKESMTIYPPESHHTTLTFEYLHTNAAVIIGLGNNNDPVMKDNLYLDVAGESTLCLQNTHDEPIKLLYFYQTQHNKKYPAN